MNGASNPFQRIRRFDLKTTSIRFAFGIMIALSVYNTADLKPGITAEQPDCAARLPGAWTNLFTKEASADVPQRGSNERDSILVEDFDDALVGECPSNWMPWRGERDEARNMYTVREEENGNRYLHADDDGASVIIQKRFQYWNANEYPVLSWRWRAQVMPEGGDERIGSKNDSAVSVYVVLDRNFFWIPRTLKYVWSTTLPIGTNHRREGVGRPHVIVLRSGNDRLGEWVEEKVNVQVDYIRVFGNPPPRKAVGIGILTDSNATRSDAQGDYDDFVIHRAMPGH